MNWSVMLPLSPLIKKLTLTDNGYAFRSKEYNKMRQVTQECYYDKEGKPVLNK